MPADGDVRQESQAELIALRPGAPRLFPGLERMANWPWWLVVAILLGLLLVLQITTNQQMSVVFRAVAAGLGITIRVTVAAYALAIVIGLVVGLARVSSNRIVLNVASFYVEIVRGAPILVLLMYIAFVVVPLGVSAINALGGWLLENAGFGLALTQFKTRNFPNEVRVVVALAFAYGAFESEVFRAGIQSIERGQMEAARALGMNYIQAMWHIILPQAIRRILPALGNDFIAMLKDSSLVSVLGVEDITQKAKLYAASTFLFF
ncbi:MAG: amino acid ABC transporter, partial [Chloroflexi bacterium RBG_16_63_12]